MSSVNGTSNTAPNQFAGLNAASAAGEDKLQEAQDRFLKLLVTQMQNQDPLNPMDNAQVTSQMAQISTVNGLKKLNRTMEGIGGQFSQMRAMQGAALVGRAVVLEGDALSFTADGLGQGGFDLKGSADSVKVEVLSGAGRVIDTIDMGAETAGRHGFSWTPRQPADAAEAQRFRVVAKSGTVQLPVTQLTRDLVDAVSLDGEGLTLELRFKGSTPYNLIKAFN